MRDRWLYSTEDGMVGLGVRSFLDLRGWFRSNDVPSCEVCNEPAIKVVSVSIFLVKITLLNCTEFQSIMGHRECGLIKFILVIQLLAGVPGYVL